MANKIGFHADPQPKTADQKLAEAARKRSVDPLTAVGGFVEPAFEEYWDWKREELAKWLRKNPAT